jgi:hypothetical protein
MMTSVVQDEMRLRHHHEADVLCAVQRLDWEWKLREIGASGQSPTAVASVADSTDVAGTTPSATAVEVHVPLVAVDDDLTFQSV